MLLPFFLIKRQSQPKPVPDVLFHVICVSLSLLFSLWPVGTLTFSPSTMKFRLRVMDADVQRQQKQSQSSSSWSPYTYFTEQTSRAGFPSRNFSGGHPPEIRGFDVVPFQRFSGSPVIHGIPTPFPESSQKEVIVLVSVFFSTPLKSKSLETPLRGNHHQSKPNSGTLTKAKWKPTQPATTGESSESYSETSKKKIKEEWSCAICYVTATSDRIMNNHKEGKKHTANLVELLQKGKPVIPYDVEEKTGSETKGNGSQTG
ncbi:hypothetical protein L2E82_31744 [Cichorium intybus]|uniref:Uncharacterized protein n=1 Tax=Cichorium intybus TaxID=13427 RepID=A0ACB9BG38_CICIN|nr:hypothetical protein L2E82_31744 [Cichorium intybus]